MEKSASAAIITGGGGALGSTMADAFSKRGIRVAVCDVEPERAQAVSERINGTGGHAIPVTADVADEKQVQAAVDETVEAFGTIHILINNAGTNGREDHRKKRILELDRSEWDRVMAVNLTGVFNCSKAVLPMMVAQKTGAIVNISSLAAKTGGLINGVHYVASKAGMIGFTKALAREYAAFNIRCNTLCLGRIATRRNLDVPEDFQQRILRQIPLGRLGTAEEVAETVLFLISDAASYITGATLDMNGGWRMD